MPFPLRATLLMLLGAALGACSPGSEPAPPAAAAARGAQIYEGNCLACHQRDGRGVQNVYPTLAGSALVNGEPAALARWVILGERSAAMPAARTVAAMPKYGWLKHDDAAALLTYVRQQFGNQSAAVSPADIARALGQ